MERRHHPSSRLPLASKAGGTGDSLTSHQVDSGLFRSSWIIPKDQTLLPKATKAPTARRNGRLTGRLTGRCWNLALSLINGRRAVARGIRGRNKDKNKERARGQLLSEDGAECSGPTPTHSKQHPHPPTLSAYLPKGMQRCQKGWRS